MLVETATKRRMKYCRGCLDVLTRKMVRVCWGAQLGYRFVVSCVAAARTIAQLVEPKLILMYYLHL